MKEQERRTRGNREERPEEETTGQPSSTQSIVLEPMKRNGSEERKEIGVVEIRGLFPSPGFQNFEISFLNFFSICATFCVCRFVYVQVLSVFLKYAFCF